MKKVLVFIMLLLLAGCGQKYRQSTTTVAEINEQETAATETLYMEEIVREDGMKITNYRQGGKDGTVIKEVWEYPNGAYYEGTYDAQGNPLTAMSIESDGIYTEISFYPSGNISKHIIRFPDGTFEETHYMDDGGINRETGEIIQGTITYKDGIYNDEQGKRGSINAYIEPGTTRKVSVSQGGSRLEETYTEDDILIRSIWTNPNTGHYSEREYYENGFIKRMINLSDDGTKQEYRCNEQGYVTYEYEKNLIDELEYFADDSGKLVKYIENDTVYEGDAISGNTIDTFEVVQDMITEMNQRNLNP